MSSPTQFYTHLSALVDRHRRAATPPLAADPAVWRICVQAVLAEAYPTVPVAYSVSQNLRATPADLGAPAQFEVQRASLDVVDDTYAVAVEAQYETTLPYTTQAPHSRPVRPRDYGPALVVYQLVGDVHPTRTDARADVRVFPGTQEEFAPPESSEAE